MTRLQNLRLGSTPPPLMGPSRIAGSGTKKQLDFGKEVKSSFQPMSIIPEVANEDESEVVQAQPHPGGPDGYTPQE